MNNLINITLNENHEPVVSGRQLHKALGVKTAYKDWFPRMTEYGFTEGEDFSSFLSKSTGGRPSQDHIIKLDMAKEIAMIQRTDKGKEVRTYFIQVEKDFNSPEKIMARALLMADKKIKLLENQNENLLIELEEATKKRWLPRLDFTNQGQLDNHPNCSRLRDVSTQNEPTLDTRAYPTHRQWSVGSICEIYW